jgi:hypothetical protein
MRPWRVHGRLAAWWAAATIALLAAGSATLPARSLVTYDIQP